jgi:hypothetical protein
MRHKVCYRELPRTIEWITAETRRLLHCASSEKHAGSQARVELTAWYHGKASPVQSTEPSPALQSPRHDASHHTYLHQQDAALSDRYSELTGAADLASYTLWLGRYYKVPESLASSRFRGTAVSQTFSCSFQ